MNAIRVMVVDDEPGMRLGVARALKEYSVCLPDIEGNVCFEIVQAASGEEALEAIAANPPDLLLLDHKLGGLSGLDVLERINGNSGDMLTVMITAYASLDTAITATKRGAYDFLAKPFTPDELRGAVRKAAKHLLLQRQARRLAEEKRQVRFQFISVLGHELKSPIAAIEGYLKIMRDRVAGNELSDYDHMINRSLVRMEGMRKLIADLLDMTRIESGNKKRQVEMVDIADVAAEVLETFSPQAAERNIAISCDGQAVTMPADRGEIEIILNNLVSNAVKYNTDGGRVDLRWSIDGPVVTIEVVDTGIGMAADEVDRLFGEFVRIKNEKTRNILGSGLGLSIVKKLTALYGGEAKVVSEPNVGTTITVSLRTDLAEPTDEHQ